MKDRKKFVIIGGVAGGASAAARLRRLDENAKIIVFERGEYISFANCGLPYYIGGIIEEKSALILQTPKRFDVRFNIDVRIKSEVISLNPEEKIITVKDYVTGETYIETYDKLILSTGAEPIIPDIDGIRSDKVFTLRSIPDSEKIKDFIKNNQPKNAAIMGGGFIGVEMAENLQRAGLCISLIEMADQVIAPLDYDMACEVHRHMQNKGVNLFLGNAVRSVQNDGSSLKIQLDKGELTADMLILATGVKPETRLAREAGIQLNERGAVVVDNHMLTSDKDIYAVGDAVEITDFVTGNKGFVPLAGPANKQGRIAADNICGIGSVYEGTQGSLVIKVFDLTVAATGINEKTARRLKLSYDKAFTYSANHAGYYPDSKNMSVKTIFEVPTGKLLGVQIVGYEGVDKRCDVFATAIRAGLNAADLTKLELCYAPPFGSAKDPVNMAGYVIENLLTGKVKYFHWHDVDALPRDGRVTLLDTRTPAEYKSGHIDGFINLPLDTLRKHMDEIPRSKPVYVYCQTGLRSYYAARILSQNGYEVYNLSGGYRLYRAVLDAKEAPEFSCHIPEGEFAGKTKSGTKAEKAITVDTNQQDIVIIK